MPARQRATDSSIASVSASTLSLEPQHVRLDVCSGADFTDATTRAAESALTSSSKSTPSASASAWPATFAGSAVRGELVESGSLVRPPSAISDSMGVMSPPAMSARSQFAFIDGPLNSDVSTATDTSVPRTS